MLYTFSKANYDLAWLTQTLAQFDENDIALTPIKDKKGPI